MSDSEKKLDSEVVTRLRVAVRQAEADAAFVDGATLPIGSMLVAVIVAAVVLESQDVAAAFMLTLTAILLTVVGLAAIRLRPRRARRVFEAQEQLDSYLKDPEEVPEQKRFDKLLSKFELTGVSLAGAIVLLLLFVALVKFYYL